MHVNGKGKSQGHRGKEWKRKKSLMAMGGVLEQAVKKGEEHKKGEEGDEPLKKSVEPSQETVKIAEPKEG